MPVSFDTEPWIVQSDRLVDVLPSPLVAQSSRLPSAKSSDSNRLLLDCRHLDWEIRFCFDITQSRADCLTGFEPFQTPLALHDILIVPLNFARLS